MTRSGKTLFENVQELRKLPETSRVGNRYHICEDKDIIKDAKHGVPIECIARKQKRTVAAIRQRIIMFAIEDMRANCRTLEETSTLYNINMSLLSSYHQRKCEKEKAFTKMIRDACLSVGTSF